MGEIRESYSLNQPSAIPTLLWMAGREGVTWQRSMKEKMGRFPGPQAVLSPPAQASALFSAKENNQKRAGHHRSPSGGAEPRKCQAELNFPNKRICRIASEPRSAKHTEPSPPFAILTGNSKSSSPSPNTDAICRRPDAEEGGKGGGGLGNTQNGAGEGGVEGREGVGVHEGLDVSEVSPQQPAPNLFTCQRVLPFPKGNS